MNVKELKKLLKDYPDNMPVVFTYNYGDHWRTQVAASIQGAEIGKIIHSDYHGMDKVVDEEDRKYEEAEEALLLNSRSY